VTKHVELIKQLIRNADFFKIEEEYKKLEKEIDNSKKII